MPSWQHYKQMGSLYGVIEENSFRPKKKETFVVFHIKCVEYGFFA